MHLPRNTRFKVSWGLFYLQCIIILIFTSLYWSTDGCHHFSGSWYNQHWCYSLPKCKYIFQEKKLFFIMEPNFPRIVFFYFLFFIYVFAKYLYFTKFLPHLWLSPLSCFYSACYFHYSSLTTKLRIWYLFHLLVNVTFLDKLVLFVGNFFEHWM